jgi:hypothetical protein
MPINLTLDIRNAAGTKPEPLWIKPKLGPTKLVNDAPKSSAVPVPGNAKIGKEILDARPFLVRDVVKRGVVIVQFLSEYTPRKDIT